MDTVITDLNHELVLQLCRFLSPQKERLVELMEGTPDWAYVLGLLLYNRMGGAAYATLQNTGLFECTNREFRSTLKAVYNNNTIVNSVYSRLIRLLAELLDGAPFSYAALKGAVLCEEYPPGIRTANDIDLLVNGCDVSALSTRLEENGFRQGWLRGGKFTPASRRDIINSRLNRGETVPFVCETGEEALPYLEIDINFSLDFKARQENGAVSDMLSHAVNLDGLHTLCAEHFLIHLCAHLYKEASMKSWVDMGRDQALYKYADLYFLLQKRPVEIERFVEAARLYSQENACFYALANTAELFGLNGGPVVQLLDGIRPLQPYFMNEVYAPDGKSVYRHDYSITEWLFHPNRKEILYEAADAESRFPGNAHYFQRFGRIR